VFDLLANLLAFFYDLWPSYGVAIILFTLTIMLLLTPLSIKSTRSMIAMQRVQPELKKLQQKHKGDREALNKEMMAFYQENNINPFSSCLPLLLQMPVFIVLYQVLSGLTRRAVKGDPTSNFNPKYFEGEDAPLAVALRATNKMMSFGMDLSRSALSTLQDDGVVKALPYIILVGLVALTAWYQQRQIQGRNLNRDAPINPQQQMITKILPFIFIPISISLPAGVVIYFVVSNLVRIGQQAAVTKLEFGPDGQPKHPKKPKPPADDAIETTSRDATPAKGTDTPGPGKSGTGKTSGNGAGTPPARTSANGNRTGSASSRPRNRKRKRK
jgi:YidC/Oxa1 family membrane protein insertase